MTLLILVISDGAELLRVSRLNGGVVGVTLIEVKTEAGRLTVRIDGIAVHALS